MADEDIRLLESMAKGVFKGEMPPKLSFDQPGRIKLISALSKKYGTQFRNNSSADDLLKMFDKQMGLMKQIRMIRRAGS